MVPSSALPVTKVLPPLPWTICSPLCSEAHPCVLRPYPKEEEESPPEAATFFPRLPVLRLTQPALGFSVGGERTADTADRQCRKHLLSNFSAV